MSIGYACIALGVRGAELKGCILKNATIEKMTEITISNMHALDSMLEYNLANGIRLFRISSDIVPFGSHPANTGWEKRSYEGAFEKAGAMIKASGIRVSMHPGQYTVLNSPDPEISRKAAEDLAYHTAFLEKLDVDASNKIILHIGGAYGDREKSSERFAAAFARLPDNIKARIAIENDEKNYSIDMVLEMARHLGIPAVFDNLHNRLNPPSTGGHNDPDETGWIRECSHTWKSPDGRQKIHYSQQQPGGKPGAHSGTIRIRPFMDFYDSLNGMDIDIMLEVKDKNLSALKCIYSTSGYIPAAYLEKEWARYKYLVLERSHNKYLGIREFLKTKRNLEPAGFYEIIEEALAGNGDSGSQTNALQHVWGYFKKFASESEKSRYLYLLDSFKKGTSDQNRIKRYLLRLSEKYDVGYLLDSYYFCGIQ